MKKIKYFTFSVLLICLLFSVDRVFAKEIKTSCEYKLPYQEGNYKDQNMYVWLKGYVYDDDTTEVYHVAHTEGTSYGEKLLSSAGYDRFTLFDEDNKIIFYEENFFGFVNKNVLTSNPTQRVDVSKFKLYNGKCADLVGWLMDSNYVIEFTETGKGDDLQAGWGQNYSHMARVNQADFIEDSTINKVELTSTCTRSVSSKHVNNGSGFDITFNMYSDGTKEFCIAELNGYLTGKVVCSEASDLVSYWKDNNTHWYFAIDKGQVDKIYKQNFAQLENNKFTCPEKLYINNEGKFDTSSNWYISTEAYSNDVLDTNSGSLAENGEKPNINTGGNLEDGKGMNFDVGNTNCSVLGEGSRDLIITIINGIKVAGIVLVIGLSILDAIGSLASFKDEQNKKFYNRLLNRMICLAILFLLPSIINLILNFISSNDQISLILQDPFCGLV